MVKKEEKTQEEQGEIDANNGNGETTSNSDNKEEKKVDVPTVSYFKLYRYSTCLDKMLILVALIFSMAGGVGTPVMMIFFGDITNEMVTAATAFYQSETEEQRQEAADELMNAATNFAIYSSILGGATFVVVYISTMIFNYTCVRQISKIRSLYMRKVLNQDIAWYDLNKTGDFSSRVTEDLAKLEEGLGDKAGTFSFFISTFISGIVVAFVYGWELALICLAYLPLSSVAIGFVTFLSTKISQEEMESYGAAGAIAEEVLTAIKTVFAFGGQQKEIDRYKAHLIKACKNNIKRSLLTAISNGLVWFFMFASYALSFWYGIGLILDEWHLPQEERTYTVATLIIVFFSVLMATFTIGMSAPYIQIFGTARGAAAKIFFVIDSEPVINLSKGKGKRMDKFEGRIEFKDVHFSYPSRDEVKILQGVDIRINPGETVALVGSSGCGKSTCVQLMQRFYDPTSGNIHLDDIDMREFDLTWLRNQIGVVGQEPVLFGMSIAENIKFGKSDATQEEIEIAAKKSNAHNFITALPDGYNTLVGERGSQLSGGQKQRIAIARALVRQPTILLLDEATSALDTNSEAQVQRAIDSVSNECTTIIVAHRLSTIRNANKIIVFQEGKVVEEGTHNDLIARHGVYYNLVNAQISPDDFNDNSALESTYKDETHEEIEEIKLVKEKNEDDEEEEEVSNFRSLPSIMRLNRPEWWQITIGSITALISGASFPVYAVVFGEMIGIFSLDDPQSVREEGDRFSLYFLIIGIVSGITTFFQWYMIGFAGEKLTKRVRALMFESVLRQEIGWYDKKENGVGAICAKLSSDAAAIQGAAGQPLVVLLNSVSTLTIALALALYFEWRLALVSLSVVPLILIGTYFEEKINNATTAGKKNALQMSTKIAIEAISNVRTVASLGCEEAFYVLYTAELLPHYQKLKRGVFFRAFILGLSRCMMFFSYGIAFYYGAILIIDYDVDFRDVFKVSEALISAAWSVGSVMAFSPNFQKGIIAAGKMFKLVNRVPLIKDGPNSTYSGWKNSQIKYEKVSFAYPTRPNINVLNSLMLMVNEGKTVALVGPSGCGKSTIIQLLQRFYDPLTGSVGIDSINLCNIRIMALRSNLGIVSQEPNLFDRTIGDNIAYGDNTRVVTQEEIIEAAKNANIHTFITSLPLGYETRLGEKGTQLSGGQKQRVAIARALIRNPQILLLDEATSALDTESEKVVQEALDKAKLGRTCITIAHRLTTIQDSDVIYVMNKGIIIEQGTHEELLNLKGLYHKLSMIQRGHH